MVCRNAVFSEGRWQKRSAGVALKDQQKKDDMFASMVQIGTVASDGVVKKRKTVSIACVPKDNEDRIDSGLHESKGLGG